MTVPFDGVSLTDHRRWYETLADLGYTDAWSAETDGVDGFTPLALAAAWVPRLRLGVAIIPAYTRGPALVAQSIAGMAEAAPGRFTFGLGTSSDVIVSRWNGIPFNEPYRRARDMLRFLRAGSGRREGRPRLRHLLRARLPVVTAGRATAAPAARRPPTRHAAPGRQRGRWRHPQLALGRRREEGGGRARRSGHGGRPHLRVSRRRTPRWPGPSAVA